MKQLDLLGWSCKEGELLEGQICANMIREEIDNEIINKIIELARIPYDGHIEGQFKLCF